MRPTESSNKQGGSGFLNVAGGLILVALGVAGIIALAPSTQTPGSLSIPISVIEDTNVNAAVVIALPETGEMSPAAIHNVFKYLLGLAGRPDIVLVGAPSSLSQAAESLKAATGCEVVLAPLPTTLPVASTGACKGTAYETSVADYLVSKLLFLPSVSSYSLLLLLHSTALSAPLHCDPFRILHTTGGVYANLHVAATPGAAVCTAGLKAFVEKEISADKVPLDGRYGAWSAAQTTPVFQVIQAAFWRQPRIRQVLENTGAAIVSNGWTSAPIFEHIAAAAAPSSPGLIELGSASACGVADSKMPVFEAFSPPIAPSGPPGLYFIPGTPSSDQAAMLGGTHRAAFVAVVREAQAAMLAYSERLVVVEVNAGNGYISLVGMDQQGASKSVLTARELFVNETKIGGYKGHLDVVLVEDEPVRYAAARANAALAGPDRIRACAVLSDVITKASRSSVNHFPHNTCGLDKLLAHRPVDPRPQRQRRRNLIHDPTMDAPSAASKPAALIVLNEPSSGALSVLKALLQDGTAAAVVADLTVSSSSKDAWAPFVALLSASGFSTHALVRPSADRLNDPEPPAESMFGVPSNGTTLDVFWARATSFVSARKPLLHLDAECKDDFRKFAVIGTDSKPIYAFGSVVAVIFWREMLGWSTIVFALPDLHDVFKTALVQAGAQVVTLKSKVAVEHPERPWISQAARMTAANLPGIRPCDYLITSDSDMGPLSVPYFRDPLTNPAYDLHIHNGYHWQTKGNRQYPMCYAGMTASAWRFLLAPFGKPTSTPDNIVDAFAEELNQGDWYLDQHVLYRMVARWTLFFGNDRLLRSEYHDKRIDRGPDVATARSRLNFGGVDLHLLRPPYAPDTWSFYRDELIPHFFPKDRVKPAQEELDAFIRKFTEAFAGPDGLVESGSGPDGAKQRSAVYSPPPAS